MSKPTIIAHFGAAHDCVTLNLPAGQQIIDLSQFRAKPASLPHQGENESPQQFERRIAEIQALARKSAKTQRHAAIELIVEFWAKARAWHITEETCYE